MLKKKMEITLSEIVLCVILVLYSALMLYLMYWGLLTSVKTNEDFLINQNFFGKPDEWAFENYQAVFNRLYVRVTRGGRQMNIGIAEQAVNTLLYAVGGALLSAIAPFLVSYACTRFDYKFNEVLSAMVLIVMIVPIVGSAASMVSLLHQLRIYDTMFSIYCEKFIFTSIYFLIYRGIMGGVSKSFSEAATIDGANEIQIMLLINFPLIFNVFMTVVLIHFIRYWNDYQTPLLYMPTHPTLAYGVYFLTNLTTGDLNITPRKMAGCMVLAVPILILFVAFKDKLMGNLSMGGVKE